MRTLLAAASLAFVAVTGGSPQPVLVRTITTGHAPCGAVSAFGSVWVANDGGTLVRIDPKRNRVVRRIRVGAAHVRSPRAGAHSGSRTTSAASTRVTPRGRVKTIDVGSTPFDVLVAYGRVWVTAWEAGELAVVEPRTLKVVRRIDVGPRPVGLAHAERCRLGRIRPKCDLDRARRSAHLPARSRRGRRPRARLVRRRHEGSLDPGQRRRPRALRPGRTPGSRSPRGRRDARAGAVAPDGTIWMPDKERSVVHRVDPKRQRIVDSFPAGPGRLHRAPRVPIDVGHELRRERRAPLSAEEGRRQTAKHYVPRSDLELLERPARPRRRAA